MSERSFPGKQEGGVDLLAPKIQMRMGVSPDYLQGVLQLTVFIPRRRLEQWRAGLEAESMHNTMRGMAKVMADGLAGLITGELPQGPPPGDGQQPPPPEGVPQDLDQLSLGLEPPPGSSPSAPPDDPTAGS